MCSWSSKCCPLCFAAAKCKLQETLYFHRGNNFKRSSASSIDLQKKGREDNENTLVARKLQTKETDSIGDDKRVGKSNAIKVRTA